MVIPDYDHFRDKRPLCQLCDVANYYFKDDLPEELAQSHDYRFKKDVCQELDDISREDWRETLKVWHERRKEGRNPEAENAKTILHELAKGKYPKPWNSDSDEDIEF